MIWASLLLFSMTELPESLLEKLQKLEVQTTPHILVVSISNQKLTFFEGTKVKSEYTISTARNGIGQKVNTFQTPLGLHRIKEKIGEQAPSGAIFESRVFYGHLWDSPLSSKESPENQTVSKNTDLITSRILWLEGLEPGLNAGNDSEGNLVDSYQRYIYIHGTNHEDEIGKPTSRGCIRMFNTEVIQLFDQVQESDLVWIQE